MYYSPQFLVKMKFLKSFSVNKQYRELLYKIQECYNMCFFPVFVNTLQSSTALYFVDFEEEECFSQRLEKNTMLTIILSWDCWKDNKAFSGSFI